MLEIKEWFIEKNFGHCYDFRIIRVIRETEKAIFVDLYNTDTEEFSQSWLPKSVLEVFASSLTLSEEIEKLKDRELLDKFMKELDEAHGINEEDLPF